MWQEPTNLQTFSNIVLPALQGEIVLHNPELYSHNPRVTKLLILVTCICPGLCHMHKPRLSKEYQDGKVTKSGQPWQPRQTSFQSHFLNTHIEQTRTGPSQIAHTSTLCYRGTLLPFIGKLMTGNIQLN